LRICSDIYEHQDVKPVSAWTASIIFYATGDITGGSIKGTVPIAILRRFSRREKVKKKGRESCTVVDKMYKKTF